MTDIAFYAPMKAPTHATPSGDREMARGLMRAIGIGPGQAVLVSDLNSRDGKGNPERQRQIMAEAEADADRLITELKGSDIGAWITYHNYYKAPDLIGPRIARALNIPYLQIESTRARSRLDGPWAGFAQAAEVATDAADVVFYLTALDRLTLERDRPTDQRLVHLRPFLPVDGLPPLPDKRANTVLSAGMFRAGDKLASYGIIAETLARLKAPDWRFEIAGDGPARAAVEALMRPFGDRVRFLGQLDRDQMQDAYRAAGIFLWPGVNEAYGMVYLEAQAAGLPVVAQDRPGVRDVLAPGSYPTPEEGPEALAARLDALLADDTARLEQGLLAQGHVAAHHLIGAASVCIWGALTPLMEGRS